MELRTLPGRFDPETIAERRRVRVTWSGLDPGAEVEVEMDFDRGRWQLARIERVSAGVLWVSRLRRN